MLKNYLFYKDYLKNRNIDNIEILISKTKNSYLIGPIINNEFDEKSFYKRLTSNSIYTNNIYKKMFNKKARILIEKYGSKLHSNEVIEVYSDKTIIHNIIRVPGDYNG